MNESAILQELEVINEMLYKNQQLFNLAEDDRTIEALIFERKSLCIRYDGLIAQAREQGISVDYIKRADKKGVIMRW